MRLVTIKIIAVKPKKLKNILIRMESGVHFMTWCRIKCDFAKRENKTEFYVTGCMMTINYFEEPQVCSVHSPSFRVYAVTACTVPKRLHRSGPHLPYMYQSCVDHAWLPTE